jgi:peptidyl-prolyl cis-trans isomerase SurA
MQEGDMKTELFRAFDETQKAKMGYVFFQENYNEMLKLCDDYFPTDTSFYNLAGQMTKPVMQLQGKDFPQYEFADYIRLRSTSQKTCSSDFLHDQYTLFVREILTKLTEKSLETDPEFINLMNEYHDGILFFEVSDTRVWSKPVEEQEALEQEWIQELNSKYQVTINKKVVKNIKKYMKKR